MTSRGAVERLRSRLRDWWARRQGRYLPAGETRRGWHGRGGHRRHQTGWRAEEYAARRLWSMGYHVLERNVQVGRWEIDIVAQQGDTLVFVEVKSGRSGSGYNPRDRVDEHKRRTAFAAGELYVKRRGLGEVRRRWDVAEVRLNDDGRPIALELFRDAL